MKNFSGKRALIIGGSEGIGLALAEELLKENAHVAIASRSSEKIEKALDTLSMHQGSNKLVGKTIDVTKVSEMADRLDDLVTEFGIPDLLINSAGVAHPQYLDQIEADKIDRMVQLNTLGPIHVCRLLLPKMMKNGGGHILNVSSVAGYVGLFGYTAYCASKAGIIAFSEALREELIHSDIKVSVLCPPNTKTPGLERENLEKPPEVLATEEKVKVLKPSEVARYTLRRLRKDDFWIIPTMDSQLAWYLKRFAPAVLRRFVRRPAPNA